MHKVRALRVEFICMQGTMVFYVELHSKRSSHIFHIGKSNQRLLESVSSYWYGMHDSQPPSSRKAHSTDFSSPTSHQNFHLCCFRLGPLIGSSFLPCDPEDDEGCEPSNSVHKWFATIS